VTGRAALYECSITHARTAPLHNTFTYRTYMWLVDLDALPRLARWTRPLAGFRAADHLGDPRRGIRENLDAFLRARGVDLGGGQVIMLAHARVFGYVFNPLSLYWCHAADGSLACVVAEVHNTYGQRHAYLLRTDGAGRAQARKDLYVSPFYPVDGSYRMSLPEPELELLQPRPGHKLRLSVVLDRPDGHSFIASVRGRSVPASNRTLLGAAIRHPWSTAVVTVRIRWQGLKLYRRGLRVVPRPVRLPREGVQ
jgi:uncharacterized protein